MQSLLFIAVLNITQQKKESKRWLEKEVMSFSEDFQITWRPLLNKSANPEGPQFTSYVPCSSYTWDFNNVWRTELIQVTPRLITPSHVVSRMYVPTYIP